jgi:LacI family transcriptional regulator
MSESMRIGIALDMSCEYARAALRGIVSFARPNHPWTFHFLDSRAEKFVEDRDLRHLSGVIGQLYASEMTDLLRTLQIPAINITNKRSNNAVPRVGADDLSIGRLAARYFIDRGYTHFAYMGVSTMNFSQERESGFFAEIRNQGGAYSSFSTWLRERNMQESDRFEGVTRWIASLPRPLGLFCGCDSFAWAALEACREAGVAVPESVSVLGVDNDPMVCLLSTPQLSSVAVPAERIGFEAARLLEAEMSAPSLSASVPGPLLLPAKEIVTRASSDCLAIGDGGVAAAVKFIRDNAAGRIGVDDVAKAAGVARRSLERKFRGVLGRSPLEEIRRTRLELVRELLVNTDLPMPAIAARCGFESAVRLTTVFREVVGQTPTSFRRQYRVGSSEGSTGLRKPPSASIAHLPTPSPLMSTRHSVAV